MAYATGVTDKTESRRMAEDLATQADRIRRKTEPAPQLADTESLRAIMEHRDAYLAWGNSQGGRGGRPWSGTYGEKQESVLDWWIETLGLKTLRDIDLPAVEKALQEKGKENIGTLKKPRFVTGKTLTHLSMNLQGFVNWCRKRKFLAANPLEGLRKFNTSARTQRRALSLEEIGKLLAVASPERRRIYRMALVTGFRARELASLRVGDLDAEKGTIFLRADFAKDRRDANRPLPQDLAAELAQACQGLSPETPLLSFEPVHAARLLGADLDTAKIDRSTFHGKVDFHALRVTHVTMGIELGFDAKTAQELARHKSMGMTSHYAKANPDRLRKAVDELGRAVSEAEKTHNSRKEVKRAVLAKAAGAENLTEAPAMPGDTPNLVLVRERGFEPPRPCGH